MFLNIQKINHVFLQLRNDPKTIADQIEVEDVFPNTNRITLEEQQAVVDYIQAKFKENNYPVYINVTSEYEPSFWCLLEKDGIYYSDDFDKKHLYSEGNYFAITYSQKSDFNNLSFEEKESKIFGKLRVQYLQPIQLIGIRQPDSEVKVRPDIAITSKVLTWKKLFMQ